MSTRGVYRFRDGSNHGPFTVYKHSDNYPWGEHGGVAAIKAALPYTWPLPRFEANEFAAGFVAAHKRGSIDWARQYIDMALEKVDTEPRASLLAQAARYRSGEMDKLCGGGVRLMNTPDATSLDHIPGDCQYLYDVSFRRRDGKPHSIYALQDAVGDLWIQVFELSGADAVEATLMAEGPLDEMLQHFKEWPKDSA